MSSRNKNFRRVRHADDEETPPPTKTKPPRRLSFADEEEDVTRKPTSSSSKLNTRKPSSSSHRLTTPKTTSSFVTNVQPQTGQYTKEKLLELEKNTPTLSRPRHPPLFILKGLVKPESAKDQDNDKEELLEDGLAILGIDQIDVLDQAAINAIRAKRERLRKSRAVASDYISLDGGSNHGEAEGLSDEEPEFQGRIALLGDKKGVFESVDEIEMRNGNVKVEVDEDEEEDNIWEEEQFRKGLGKRIDDGSSIVNNSGSVSSQNVQQQSYGYHGTGYQSTHSATIGPVIGGSLGVSRSAEVMSISQKAQIATQAMQQNIKRLQESHGRTTSSIDKVEESLSSSLSNITDLEKSLSAAGEKFIYMQKLRDFVSVICDFLKV
ncbi:hypothetical protein IFM89_006071 [Coptis chinensis]|uniref:Uncharacterized protein n=1 Tax=Coptis chinensis TaxID=261450 RepID=A0A835H1R4_9MAGN|nr:hypothetical protein IFM89_006071 [Coptis chinensis]